MFEEPGNGVPGGRHHQPHDDERLHEGHDDRQPGLVGLARQNRGQQHHRHDGKILKDQDPDRRAAVNRIAFAPAGQRLQHDGRAAERQQKSPEDALLPGEADQQRPQPGHEQHAPQLNRRGHQEQPAQRDELHQRKLDADGKQQEHDTDLGQHLDRADVRDEIEPVRTDHRARHEESGDGRQPELMEYKDDGDRNRENDQQIAEDAVVSHGRRW